MNDLDSGAAPAKLGGDLKLATRIRKDDVVRACSNNIVGFASSEVARHRGLGQVVGAGGAAAEVGLGHLDDRHAGNRCEQFARGFAHTESVREMTGVVISDAASEFALRICGRVEQQGTQVADFRGNRERILGEFRFVFEQCRRIRQSPPSIQTRLRRSRRRRNSSARERSCARNRGLAMRSPNADRVLRSMRSVRVVRRDSRRPRVAAHYSDFRNSLALARRIRDARRQ